MHPHDVVTVRGSAPASAPAPAPAPASASAPARAPGPAREPASATVRTVELERLEQVVTAAAQGRPALAELTGDPGTGKSRLLTALARRADDRGVRTLRGRCAPADAAVPYQPILNALSSWRSDCGDGAPPAAAAGLIRALSDTSHGAGTGFGGHPRRRGELRRLIGACLAESPGGLLLVLDDYHWADPHTAGFLETLVQWPVDGGLGVVVAHRPRQIPAAVRAPLHEGVEEGSVDLVELTGLAPAQTATLLGTGPDDPTTLDLHVEGAANPLYVLALAAVRPRGEDASYAGSADVRAARGLGVRLHAETQPLDGETRTVIHAAAVVGDAFTVDTVAAVAGIERGRACACLAELRRLDLVRTEGPGRLTFRHPLLRRCVYEETDACWRAGAHGRALAALRTGGAPATELAPHVERAGIGTVPADRRILATAARTALHLGRPATAAHWLTVAMRLDRATGTPREEQVPAELWRSVVQALAAEGDADRVSLLAREILAAPSAHAGAGAVAFLSGVQAALGRDEEAQALLAAELSADTGADPESVALLQLQQQVSRVLAGQVPARADIESLVRRTAHRLPLTAAGALALRGLCAVVAGDTSSAEWALDAAAQTLDGLDGPDGSGDGTAADGRMSPLLLLLSWAEALMGWYGPATGHAERAVAAVREAGDVHLLVPLLDTLGYIHYQSGRMPEALAAAQECRDLATAAGRRDHVKLSDAITAAAWAQLGLTRSVGRHEGHRPTGDPLADARTPLNALLLAEAHLARGEGEAALGLLLPRREAWRVCEPVAVFAARGYELLAAAALAAGPERTGLDPATIEEWADHSAEAAVAVGIAEQRGHALLARGHALLSRRQTAEAAGRYAEAYELLGADSPAGARARELVRAVGSGTAPAPGTAPGTTSEGPLAELTLREKQVAELAGEGRKTKEIALRLTVSPRTVDAHLTRIYSKLGVNSRAELVRLVALAD
ncbi:ATP-binding protein [Streptomyces sp. NPDC096339]|uniref:ATP-binding protein n=1 Tax=Streptomyces sp. NPDC096339 TaxID=3366086 RepID=UPI00382AFDDB